MNLNDWSAIAAFLLLFGTPCAALGYLVGCNHGHEAGRLIGETETRHDLIPRVMRAKRDGVRAGRILGMREAIREMLPTYHQQ